MNIAFGYTFDDRRVTKLTSKVAKNVGLDVAETFLTVTNKREFILENINVKGVENLDSALAEGKGAIAFSAHMGNFMALGCKMVREG